MNTLIPQLARRADDLARAQVPDLRDIPVYNHVRDLEFAQLIVRECRTVVAQVYRATPLELCGPLLTADEEIAKHFYGVEE